MNKPTSASQPAAPGKGKWLHQLKDGLHLAAQLIVASPLKLPLKWVQGAKYVALAISLLDQLLDEPAEAEHLTQQADETAGN